MLILPQTAIFAAINRSTTLGPVDRIDQSKGGATGAKYHNVNLKKINSVQLLSQDDFIVQ